MYAAAVILPFGVDIPGLNDSKQLTEKMREALFPIIQETAVAWAIASVSAQEIDATDILTARMKAMDWPSLSSLPKRTSPSSTATGIMEEDRPLRWPINVL